MQGPDPDPGDGPGAFAAALADPAMPPPPAIGRGQARRLDIHRNNCAHALGEALGATFPAVRRLVGERFFAALARAYAAAEPPASPLLFEWGGGFAAFCEGFPPLAGLPYLGDVARFEWLRLRAYHAADAEPVGLAALSRLGPTALEKARIGLHPSLGLLRARHPALSIHAATLGDADPAAVVLGRGEDIAVVRPRFTVSAHRLDPGGAALLDALAAGAALGPAVRAATAEAPEADLSALLGRLFAIGAVAAVRDADGPSPEDAQWS